MTMMGYNALQHFDYPTIDSLCRCDICVDWRNKREVFIALQQRVVRHRRSCMCPGCKEMRQARTRYHAALNKRDLFSEVSWLADGKAWAQHALDWLKIEINNPEKTDGWWEGRAPYYPLGYWLNRFHYAAISGEVLAVSGLVFSI